MNIKIEHVAMYVNNLEYARDFFVKYFNAEHNELYHNPKTGFSSYFLTFGNGTRLEIMNRPDVENHDKTVTQTGYAHIAFSLGSREAVDNLTEILNADGYEVTSPRITGDGYYESCVLDLEGNIIELTI